MCDTSSQDQAWNSHQRAAGLDVESITRMLYAHGRDRQLKIKIEKVLSSDPVFDKTDSTFLARKDRLARGLEQTRRLLELAGSWSPQEYHEALAIIDDREHLIPIVSGAPPVIEGQASDEQQAHWLPQVRDHSELDFLEVLTKKQIQSHSILGCYAQWHMHHYGVRNLKELMLTFETEEFEIHSPTTSSTKWWIGGLGVLATHCVVQARLLLPENGKLRNYGPHLFILRSGSYRLVNVSFQSALQVRIAYLNMSWHETEKKDPDSHEPLPGIEIGDIGPKVHAAQAANDNGYMRFNKVRVPRDALLNRFAKVSKEGRYSKPPHDKLSYGGMIYIRSRMISGLGWSSAKCALLYRTNTLYWGRADALILSSAITIATRYLHVRRQFSDKATDIAERPVITYPSVYMRILPVLARAYGFIVIGDEVRRIFDEMLIKLKTGNAELLPETHAITSGLKVYVSEAVIEGHEIARRACGGHGYLASNGIGQLYSNLLPAATYEGDNYILNQQVCRAALKSYKAFKTNPDGFKQSAPASSSYLATLSEGIVSGSWMSPEDTARMLSLRAALLVQNLASQAENTRIWTDLSWRCVNVSKAITEAYVANTLIGVIRNDSSKYLKDLRSKEQAILKDLVYLNMLNMLQGGVADLLELSLIPAKAVETLRSYIEQLSSRLLPSALALTDAFDFTEWELNSTIGRKDGQAYEALLSYAKETEELNLGDKTYKDSIQNILSLGESRLSKARL